MIHGPYNIKLIYSIMLHLKEWQAVKCVGRIRVPAPSDQNTSTSSPSTRP